MISATIKCDKCNSAIIVTQLTRYNDDILGFSLPHGYIDIAGYGTLCPNCLTESVKRSLEPPTEHMSVNQSEEDNE